MADAKFTFRRDGTVEHAGVVIGKIVFGTDRPWGSRTYRKSYAAYGIDGMRCENNRLHPNFWVRQRAAEVLLEAYRKREPTP